MNDTAKKRVWAAAVVLLFALLMLNEVRITHAASAEGSLAAKYWILRAQIWVAALGTLAVYSFLIRDNFFYQSFEHALLGCATGMGCAITIQDVLWTKWAIPMWGGFKGLAGAGYSSAALGGALLLIPGLIGLLWYFQFSKRHYWLSRIPLCIGLGAGAGMAFKNVLNQLLPQISGTFKPLWVGEGIVRDATVMGRVGMSAENLIFVLGTISVLSYFFFAFGRSKYGVRAPAKLGRWYLMLSLGAFFGNTFMSRLSGLIERFGFLFSEWLKIT